MSVFRSPVRSHATHAIGKLKKLGAVFYFILFSFYIYTYILFIISILLISDISASNLCNEIPIQVTEECNKPTSTSRYQIQPTKNLNLKKPTLSAKLKIMFKSKSSNDYMKFKKCFLILQQLYQDIISFKADFIEDIASDVATISFLNDTSIKVTLNKKGQIQGLIKYYDANEKLTEIRKCDHQNGKWISKDLS